VSERFFPGRHLWIFPGKLRIPLGEIKNGEISFFPLESKKTTFVVKNLIRKCQTSFCPPSDAHGCV